MRIKLWVGIMALGCVAVSACLDESITGTRPLTLTISVDPSTVVVDEVVTATYDATGTGLVGIIVNWGDGVVDSPLPWVPIPLRPLYHPGAHSQGPAGVATERRLCRGFEPGGFDRGFR